MIQLVGKNPFVIPAFLLCGAFISPRVHAGPMPPAPSEIDGEYAFNTIHTPSGNVTLDITLSQGAVSSPRALIGFSAPDLNIKIIQGRGPTLIDVGTGKSDFNLSGGTAGFILYNLSSPKIPTLVEITAVLTLPPTPPPNNTSGVSLINLNPALLTLTFPQGTNLDPSWGPVIEPVFFSITPLPEPASIVHLTWMGLLGVIGYWKWRRRAVAL